VVERSGSAGFAAKVADHGITKEAVGTSLVALALAAKPRDDVGIQPKGKLLFDGAIEGIACNVPPKFVGERRDVRKIDRAIGLTSKFGKTAPGSRRKRVRGEFLSHGSGHSADTRPLQETGAQRARRRGRLAV